AQRGQAVIELARLFRFELAFLKEIEERGDTGEEQGRVSQQGKHDVNGEPGALDDGAIEGRNGVAERGDERHYENQRKDEYAQAFELIAPMHTEVNDDHEKRAHGERFIEI